MDVADRLLPREHEDAGRLLADVLEKEGVALHLGATIDRVEAGVRVHLGRRCDRCAPSGC